MTTDMADGPAAPTEDAAGSGDADRTGSADRSDRVESGDAARLPVVSATSGSPWSVVVRWATVVVLGFVGFGMAWGTMSQGPWVANDSMTYMGVAHNLAEGAGPTSPFSHEWSGLSPTEQVALGSRQPLTVWPPAYPAMLATLMKIGLSVASAAKVVNALALGAVGAAMGALVLLGRTRRGSVITAAIAAVLAAGFFLPHLWTILVFSALASDAPFIGMVMVCLALCAAHLSRPRWLSAAAILVVAAACPLVRYTGVSVVPAVVLTVALTLPRPWWRRLGGAAVAGGIVVIPVLLWRRGVSAAPGIRPTPEYVGKWDQLSYWVRNAQSFIVPDDVYGTGWSTVALVALVALFAIALTMLAVAIVSGELRSVSAPRHGFIQRGAVSLDVVLAVTTVTYLAVVVFGAMVVDHAVSFEPRLLAPAVPVALTWIARSLLAALGRLPLVAMRVGLGLTIAVIAAGSVGWHTQVAKHAIWDPGMPGLWTPGLPSESLPSLGTSADAVIFSGSPASVYGDTGRTVYALPMRKLPFTEVDNPHYEANMRELAELAKARPVLIALDKYNTRSIDDLIAVHDALPTEVIEEDVRYLVLRSTETR